MAHTNVSILLPSKLFLSLLLVLLAACGDGVSDETRQRSREIPDWYNDAKLGIFIHWGLPSVPAYAAGRPFGPGELEKLLATGEWPKDVPYSEWYYASMQYQDGATRAYHARSFGQDTPYTDFKPMFERNVEQWDPKAWADQFEAYGARYVVLVSKHHDGYTLWPSDHPNPNWDDWSSQRDMVGELAAAVRARGMRFGVYYSTGFDWTFKLVSEGDRLNDLMKSAPASQEYADYVYAHMRELIDRYQPDLLWADIGYPGKGHMGELFEYYFARVPDGTVNDRWGGADVIATVAGWPGGTWFLKTLAGWMIDHSDAASKLEDDPARYGFKTTEYANLSGIAPFKWESTRGLGGSFGFNRNETAADMLTGGELVTYLVDTVSKNGNVLINVGPDSYGQIPDIQQQPLEELGEWLRTNGEAIYGTRTWTRFGGRSEAGTELRFTRSDDALYLIVLGDPGKELVVSDLELPIGDVELLGHGAVGRVGVDATLALDLSVIELAQSPAHVFRIALPAR